MSELDPGDLLGGDLFAASDFGTQGGGAEPPPSEHPWQRVGPYDVLGELGRGGMGRVLRARRPGADRDVAIKLLAWGRRANTESRVRFRREAQALQRLGHPNLVRLLDVGEDRGCAYVVLELIEGESLAQRLERAGPLEPVAAVRLARGVAGALEHVHAAGFLHRDLKPGNVLLDREGRPHLTDFGLAKRVGPGDSGSWAGTSLSQSGVAMGTPGFWAPELVRGDRESIGVATDVYGLGGVLYAALTGSAPIQGEDLTQLVQATLSGMIPPPSTLVPVVSPQLDRICARCLATKPSDRYPTIAAVEQALSAALAVDRARRAWRTGAACVAGLIALGAVAAWVPAERPPADPSPASTAPSYSDWSRSVRAALEAGEFELVLSLCQEGGELWPDRLSPWAERGLALVQLGRLEEAEAAWTQALHLAPASSRTYANRAGVRILRRNFTGAMGDAQRATELAPEDPFPWLTLGQIHALRGRGEDAFQAFDRAIVSGSKDASAFSGRGVARASSEPEAALEDFDRALELDRRHAEARLNRALLRRAHGELGEAERDLELLTIMAPNARAWLELAEVRLLRRDHAGALAACAAGREAGGVSARLLHCQAISLRDLGQMQEALEVAVQLTGLDPADAGAWYLQGLCQFSLGNWESALACFGQLVELIDSSHTMWLEAHALRGLVRHKLGQHQAAVEDLERGLARDLLGSDYRVDDRATLEAALRKSRLALEED